VGVVERILDLARWAPSGDNTQPWRFELLKDGHFVIHGFDTREWCVYDIDGRPSQIALGALIENIALAAAREGMRAEFMRRLHEPDTTPKFDVRLIADAALEPDPLVDQITVRSVYRRALSLRAMTPTQKASLSAAPGPAYGVQWIEGLRDRWSVARLMSSNSELRLTAPETYEVHRKVIAWKQRFSEDKVPDAAVGLDPFTTRLMGWVMRDFERVRFFNRFLGGTLAPKMQLDIVPSIACAAHFLIVAPAAPRTTDDFVAAGRAVQRFWLTATQNGLQLQPEMTPLIFAAYVREGRAFTSVEGIWKRAQSLAGRLSDLTRTDPASIVFMGRVGFGGGAASRSLRLPLDRLILRDGGRGRDGKEDFQSGRPPSTSGLAYSIRRSRPSMPFSSAGAKNSGYSSRVWPASSR